MDADPTFDQRKAYMDIAVKHGVDPLQLNAIVDQMVSLEITDDEISDAHTERGIADLPAIIEYISGERDAKAKATTLYGEYKCDDCNGDCDLPWRCMELWGNPYNGDPHSSGWYSMWVCEQCNDSWRVSTRREHKEHVSMSKYNDHWDSAEAEGRNNGTGENDGTDSGNDS